MGSQSRPLAIVTGASSGIGLELARLCAKNGFDLLIAADEGEIATAGNELRSGGARVDALQVDLATREGVDALYAAIDGRPVAALLANAGRGLGDGFLDQRFEDIRRVIDTNITGTLYLIHRVVGDMRAAGQGRVLITGSIAGYIPGSFQAVYNGTKAMIDSFALALRNELKGTNVSLSLLMPGPTDTEFFARAGMLDTKVGADDKKQPADEVAKVGFDAMMKGDQDVVSGWKNKLQAAMAHVVSGDIMAEQHRKMAEPGTAAKA